MELMKSLGFVTIEKVEDDDSKEYVIANVQEGFEELKRYKEGNLKTTPAKDFLNEV